VEVYENTFTLHSLSILATIPGTVYFYHYHKAMRKQPVDQKRLNWARRGVFIFSPLALALVITAFTYEKYNRF
jgi:Na+/H+ antiporter NhaD/arsenite permease-like protein